MLALETKETTKLQRTASRGELRAAFGVRQMDDMDLEHILELRSVVRWSADPRAFGLLRGMRDARWAVTEAPDGSLAGMVGAVPLGEIGILCHLAVHDEYRGMGLGVRLSSWAVSYLRSRGSKTVVLYSTRQAERLYGSLGFVAASRRTVYRIEEAPQTRALGHRVSPLLFGDLTELYGVDRWSYGADRSALILAILRLHPGGGLVARDSSGRIQGYLIRSASRGVTRIGPFAAADLDVARPLFAEALRASEGTAVEVTVPGPTEGPAHALLEEFGFAGRSDRLRMELRLAPGDAPGSPRSGLTHYATTPYLAT